MDRLQVSYSWLGARYTMARERMKEDRGEGPVSYIAVILLIAVIAAALAGSGVGTTIVNNITSAVQKVFTDGGGSAA